MAPRARLLAWKGLFAALAAMLLAAPGAALASRQDPEVAGRNTSAKTGAQTEGPLAEKAARTPAQQKINSQLLFEIYRRQGQAAQKGVPPGSTGVKIDQKGRALVDVRAEVTADLKKIIGRLGGTIVSTAEEYRSTIAWIPLLKLEQLAEDPAVRAIVPKAEATTRRNQ